jgi:enoyl-CoA hydratase/carnithine racemase
MSEPTVLLDRHDGVATLTLNRPAVLNAMNNAMREALLDLFARLRTDETVRAVVVTGAGERAFSAGLEMRRQLGDLVPQPVQLGAGPPGGERRRRGRASRSHGDLLGVAIHDQSLLLLERL